MTDAADAPYDLEALLAAGARLPAEPPLRGRAFWVAYPRLLAGAYPGALDLEEHREKLAELAGDGITHVINLMEKQEVAHGGRPFRPYEIELAAAGITVERLRIPDVSTPSPETVRTVLNSIDSALEAGKNVYVHCWGGRGRTGVIIGCWLVNHGWAKPDHAIAELARLRECCVDSCVRAPDTAEQASRITSWIPVWGEL